MPGLTLAQLTSLQNSTRAKQKRVKFSETLKLNSYAGLDEFVYASGTGKIDATGTAYEFRVRMRSNVGATRGVRLYQVTAAQKAPPPVVSRVPYVFIENKGLVFDAREKGLNAASEEQIINHLNAERSSNFEDIANYLESQIWRTPDNSSDDLNFWGIPTWLRPSMSAGGSYIADPVGGFNGTYIRYADGSVSATLANIDASNVDNERWRNWVATRPSTAFTVDLAQTIKRAANYSNFKPIKFLKGEMTTSDCVIFLNQNDHENYTNLVTQGSDELKSDLFPYEQVTLRGCRLIRAAQLDYDTTNSIYGCRLNQWRMLKMPGFWMKEHAPIMKDGAHNVMEIPVDMAGNLLTENPRHCGFRIHGSF
jgi:hypothetical protein